MQGITSLIDIRFDVDLMHMILQLKRFVRKAVFQGISNGDLRGMYIWKSIDLTEYEMW